MNQVNWAFWIAMQSDKPAVAIGPPGTWKTASVDRFGLMVERYVATYVLSQQMPEDFGGFPCKGMYRDPKTGNRKRVMYKVPDQRILRCFMEPSILYLDELMNTGGSTQAAALRLVGDGIPGCWICATGNPSGLGADDSPLTPPMINRVWYGEWELDYNPWDAGMVAGGNFPEPNIPIVPADWRDGCGYYGSLIVAYLGRRPDHRAVFPTAGHEGEPFASPRQWTNVMTSLAAAQAVGANKETMAKLVNGHVGNGVGAEFFTWLDEQDLPDPEAILKKPKSLKLPAAGHLSLAVLRSLIGAVRRDKTPERWEALCDCFEVGYKQRPEVCVSGLGTLWRIKPDDYSPKERNGVWQEMNRELTNL